MRDALAHRGPDGEATDIRGANALVHTRLAIIDLATGRQPLEGAQGARLIGNGEIYNYVELWPYIHNHGPKTHSDFEPALHLTADFGIAAMERLRGMYAFAYCDGGGRNVMLARDPFGIKPLYYTNVPEGIAFASEPQALIAAGFADPVVDAEKRDELIDLHYTNGSGTIFKGIERVLPGETLNIRDGEIVERHRQSVSVQSPPSSPIDDEGLLRKFDAVFQDSVDVHRRSDVPYGLFLSGGIDSSAILAVLARLRNDPILCFTAGFDDDSVADERAAAARIARHYKAEHITVQFSVDDFWQSLPAVAHALDDPTADYAALPTFKLAAEARRHVKVVLTGEGGDELLAGYGRYRRALRPWWLGGRQPLRRSAIERLGLSRTPVAWARKEQNRHTDTTSGTALQKVQAADIDSWLPNDILLKLDRCLMAHGLEGRTPFLDREMANFAASLPDDAKIRNGMGKWLLRQWAERNCPAVDAQMPKKGFTVPVRNWISQRRTELADLVPRQSGIVEAFRPDAVRSVFLAADERKAGDAAWSLLFYAVWHAVHICGASAQDDVFAVLAAGI